MDVLKMKNVGYYYNSKKHVLKDINYNFELGKVYAIVGKSGSGKTTLLSLLSGLTTPTEGTILFNNKPINKIDKYEYRSNYVGVIFQSFNLLPHLTAIENIELSMRATKKKIDNKRTKALELLNKVDLTEELGNRRILKLSGGEMQRVAIARSLSYNPEIILADEPTGNLDINTQDEIIKIFKDLAHKEKKCVIIVSHSPEVAKSADVVYELTPINQTKKSTKS